MHELLELKGKMESKKRNGIPGPSQLPKNGSVKTDKIERLIKNIKSIQSFWIEQKIINSALITINYTKIVAKTNRIKKLFSMKSTENLNDYIVGAKFENNRHVITYLIDKDRINIIIDNLLLIKKIIAEKFDNVITYENLEDVNKGKIDVIGYGITKSNFASLVVDINFIEKFSVNQAVEKDGVGDVIVTLYNIPHEQIIQALETSGINYINTKKIDDTTFILTIEQYNNLVRNASYLIAMEFDDLSKIQPCRSEDLNEKLINNFPSPSNEPTIGVIDTLFDNNVFFSEWVKEDNSFVDELLKEDIDYLHGTEISGLVVCGNIMNPHLEDGCGFFQVRHFGVTKATEMSSYQIIKNIEKIIKENRDIVVWNLSLGSEREVNENFISYEAALLDELQSKYGVIFVVSGTNKNTRFKSDRIGSPADSINSLVVNSVKLDGSSASYTRRGPVLSFFNKPDVSYYGGDLGEFIRLCNGKGEKYNIGTSYAAPWISRKLAYLIHILRMPREIAKALIIDSATSWEETSDNPTQIGFGVVPKRIEDLISTKKDEIKFYIYGVASKYDTYTYNIPVPISKLKQPFIAKATMCYFPHCSRNQGVDYTDIELDLHFGKIRQTKKGIEINCINDNKQGIPEMYGGNEEEARKEYRKWDNVKHICEKLKNRKIAKDVFGEGFWGLSIKKVSRLTSGNNETIPFGVVITLKDIFGDDHYEEFVQQCQFRGWIVNRINVQERIDIYDKIEEDINWD